MLYYSNISYITERISICICMYPIAIAIAIASAIATRGWEDIFIPPTGLLLDCYCYAPSPCRMQCCVLVSAETKQSCADRKQKHGNHCGRLHYGDCG